MPVVVAIDGPSGSGKSSVSREVAGRLGLQYLDTGAMYRAACWSALDAGLDLKDAAAVAAHVRALDLQVSTDPERQRTRVGGVDVSAMIREQRISAAVSTVATNLEVRAELRRRQREIIAAARRDDGIVAEGRDITTVVAPEAQVRILLTASEQARLERRAREVHGQADADVVESMRDVVVRRDADDATVSTFHVAADGVVQIDSSGMGFEETVQAVLAVCRTSIAGSVPA
ncbi:MAG: (d)CMP kinase [Kineosporiaceae bacterium]